MKPSALFPWLVAVTAVRGGSVASAFRPVLPTTSVARGLPASPQQGAGAVIPPLPPLLLLVPEDSSSSSSSSSSNCDGGGDGGGGGGRRAFLLSRALPALLLPAAANAASVPVQRAVGIRRIEMQVGGELPREARHRRRRRVELGRRRSVRRVGPALRP
jgi:hypothetical protein